MAMCEEQLALDAFSLAGCTFRKGNRWTVGEKRRGWGRYDNRCYVRALESRSDLLGMGVEVDCGKETRLRRY